MAVGSPACAPGFFVTDPQLVFVAPARSGPTLGVVDRLYPLPAGTEFAFEGAGDDRTLTVRHNGRVIVSVHAPVSTYVDVNFPDEPDSCDFFVWLQHRLPMPHVRDMLTSACEVAGEQVSIADVQEAILDELRKRYAEPQRAYHSWTHVEALLALFDDARPALHDPWAVLYAILFHDAVYDPRAGDNEERSAALLDALAADALPGWRRERVRRMILATKRHEVPARSPRPSRRCRWSSGRSSTLAPANS